MPSSPLSTAAAGHRPICPEGRRARDPEALAPCAVDARPYVLTATILASAMAFIDGSVITIALPVLQDDLGASFSELQWVVNGYALFLGALILVGGALGDRYGYNRIFIVGLVMFAAASLGCALAPTADALIILRALQGIGAALLVPQSLAIIAASFPKAVRGRAIGLWAGASAITTSLGPPLGGFLIDSLGWRSVFWINLPISAVALWFAWRFIPDSPKTAIARLDWQGGVLAVIGFGALTFAFTSLAESVEAGLAWPLVFAGLGIVVLALFIHVEQRAAAPLVPLSLFSDRLFAGANVMTVFLYGALSGVLFLLPFDLIERRGLSATEVGFVLLPLGVIIGVLSRPAGALADQIGETPLLATGSLLVALSAAGLAINHGDLWLGVVAPVVLLAFGMAGVVAPLTTRVMNAAPEDLSGAASGINNAASRLAGLFAVAGLGAIAAAVFLSHVEASGVGTEALRFGQLPDAGAAERGALEGAFASAYAVAMALSALLALAAAGVALAIRPARPVEADVR